MFQETPAGPYPEPYDSIPHRSFSFKVPFYIALPSALSHQTPAHISLLPPACHIFSHLILVGVVILNISVRISLQPPETFYPWT
jgi:hypothetical protein